MKRAFTLAEVLITLTIIGVIAALTIPNLMQRYEEHSTVNKVKKFYTTFKQAYSLAVRENGPTNDWVSDGSFESAQIVYDKLFKPYFKIAKDCGRASTEGNKCGSMRYSQNYYNFILSDGSEVVFFAKYDDTRTILLYLDVNGAKGPNQSGKDVFAFWGLNTTIHPFGLEQRYTIGDEVVNQPFRFSQSCFVPESTDAHKNQGCTAWVIYKGNMDYLHCRSKLSWNGQSKCSGR